VRRREFALFLCAAALAAPLRAQQSGNVRRIAVLGSASAMAYKAYLDALKGGLRDAGYVEARDISFEYRFADGRNDRLAELAAELVRMKPDVLVSHGTPATQAAKRATASIPVVMVGIADPVAAGLAESLARPGGNLTGVSNLAGDVVAKHVELMTQVASLRGVLAVLRNPANPGASAPQLKEAESAARLLGLRLQLFDVGAPGDLGAAFAGMAAAGLPAALILADPLFLEHRRQIAELAINSRVATVFPRSESVEAGGLMSYGPNLVSQFRQAAIYVDRILKGAKPADLPIEQPTKLELVLNRQTAQALGLTVPPAVLLRADRVIE